MDNAPYHTVQINKPPTAYGKKSDMIKWLGENNIQHAATMKKYQLVELIQQNKSLDKTYKVDELFKRHGHNVLRLPPYMCELNPIELAWAKVKRIIRENNTSTLTAVELTNLTEKAINDVSTEDWVGFCKHVQKIEKQYVERDNAMESIMEEIVDTRPMNATSCIDSSDSDTNSSSSSSSSSSSNVQD
nr:protein FAM243A-like [Osmia lignaria]